MQIFKLNYSRLKLMIQVKEFLKLSFFISLLFSISTFIFIRLIFSAFPISIGEDSLIFFKTILTGWVLIMAGRGAFEGLVFILEFTHGYLQNHIKSITADSAIYKKESLGKGLQYAGE